MLSLNVLYGQSVVFQCSDTLEILLCAPWEDCESCTNISDDDDSEDVEDTTDEGKRLWHTSTVHCINAILATAIITIMIV